MGAFDYDGFLVRALVKIGNMMIVSFFWLISCIPIVTIIPATAALFHTTTKVIRQSGTGVAKKYFESLRMSLKRGIPLTVITVIVGLMLYTSYDLGRQMWQNGAFWAAYYAFGFLLVFIFVTMVLFIPVTLSRFECSVPVTLRLSLFMASQNLLRSIWFLLLLLFVGLVVYIYPITLLIIPGLYFDLICGGMEKILLTFMQNNDLAPDQKDPMVHPEPEETQEEPEISSLELAELMDEPEEDNDLTGDIDE